MTSKIYRVLIDAPFVAGRRSPGKDKSLPLTQAEAEHALILGHIEEARAEASPEAPEAAAPAKRPSKAV